MNDFSAKSQANLPWLIVLVDWPDGVIRGPRFPNARFVPWFHFRPGPLRTWSRLPFRNFAFRPRYCLQGNPAISIFVRIRPVILVPLQGVVQRCA